MTELPWWHEVLEEHGVSLPLLESYFDGLSKEDQNALMSELYQASHDSEEDDYPLEHLEALFADLCRRVRESFAAAAS